MAIEMEDRIALYVPHILGLSPDAITYDNDVSVNVDVSYSQRSGVYYDIVAEDVEENAHVSLVQVCNYLDTPEGERAAIEQLCDR